MKFMKIPMEIALTFDKYFPFDIFIREDDQFTKFKAKDENRHEAFSKFLENGEEFAYVVEENYVSYLDSIKKDMKQKFGDQDPLALTEDIMTTLNNCHKVIKTFLDEAHISQESVDLAKDLASNSLKIIEKTPYIFDILNDFKDKCSQQFMVSIFVGYLTTCILENFEWATLAIKEKMIIAGMLCDSTLDFNEIEEMNQKSDCPEKLSKKVLSHPTQIKNFLKLNSHFFTDDILSIVVQHHERPDGSGYPEKLTHKNISILSAIFIVTYDFVSLLGQSNFNKSEVDSLLKTFKMKYNIGTYRRAYMALHKVFEQQSTHVY